MITKGAKRMRILPSQLAETKKVVSDQFWHCASGSEVAFNILTIDGEYLVDGKVLAKEIDVLGTLNIRGEVEVYED